MRVDESPISATLRAGEIAEIRALQALERLAWRMAETHEGRPNICWVSDGADMGDDYCEPCALEAIAEGGGTLQGGWEDRYDSPFPARCGGCDRQLSYCLSEAGLGDDIGLIEERDHPLPLSPDHAYDVACVLETALDMVIHGDREEQALGRRAIAASIKTMGGITPRKAMQL